MTQTALATIGVLLLIAALVRAGTPSWRWLLFRLRLIRLIAVGLTAMVLCAAVAALARSDS